MENKNKPLLSLCIPTYNREQFLEECLESVVHQDGFDEIEIVISDNASTDNTQKLILKYQEQYKNIKYHKNAENIGAIKNIFNLPSLASWEYVWFLSDDDMLNDIGIMEILHVIKENHPWFILSQFYWFWNGETIDKEKINTVGSVRYIVWMQKFFEFLWETSYDITPYMMLLSIFCFKKELYEKHIASLMQENGEGYLDILLQDNFIHSRIIYTPFWEENTIVVIEKDLVLCRWNNISWSFRFIVCQDLMRFIKDVNARYTISKHTLSKMKKVYYYSVFSYIVIAHVRRYIPTFFYDALVSVWRKILQIKRKLSA